MYSNRNCNRPVTAVRCLQYARWKRRSAIITTTSGRGSGRARDNLLRQVAGESVRERALAICRTSARTYARRRVASNYRRPVIAHLQAAISLAVGRRGAAPPGTLAARRATLSATTRRLPRSPSICSLSRRRRRRRLEAGPTSAWRDSADCQPASEWTRTICNLESARPSTLRGPC